ncbi:hypothetical protein VFPPC_14167 [Pochonia chlamydosporia 170]|uniref:Uncharacterized protein n=1 Tax=Pochonia chlamydosporia 170 TaxID=1380566 RepID=A0A179FAP4_METCM|nr:hypothetical protein VFPPC_14167 [Pochonia chlamydosporia 170]OAQ62179.1 hypothetical protein VFPPC_14167 [Pochonia chlamydosporia 170]
MSSENPSVPSTARQFKVNRTSFARHYDIHDISGNQLYYVDQSLFTKDKPDLTFHEGKDTNGPIVAVSHMPKFSFDCKVGLGDPSKTSVKWEELTRESVKASEYQWSMTLPEASGQGVPSGRRKFVWKRTHNVGVEGGSPSSLTLRNYKLLDVETGQLMAVFTSDRGFTTCGVLQINVEFGKDFDVMVTATCLSLYEKARKRAAHSAGGHGGGP